MIKQLKQELCVNASCSTDYLVGSNSTNYYYCDFSAVTFPITPEFF